MPTIPLDYDLPDDVLRRRSEGDASYSAVSTTYLSLDFSQLPKRILKDEVKMASFSSAASNRARISLAKRNARYYVLQCEKILQTRREELYNLTVDLANADRVIVEMWEAAVHPSNTPDDTGSSDDVCNDAESTASEASE